MMQLNFWSLKLSWEWFGIVHSLMRFGFCRQIRVKSKSVSLQSGAVPNSGFAMKFSSDNTKFSLDFFLSRSSQHARSLSIFFSLNRLLASTTKSKISEVISVIIQLASQKASIKFRPPSTQIWKLSEKPQIRQFSSCFGVKFAKWNFSANIFVLVEKFRGLD